MKTITISIPDTLINSYDDTAFLQTLMLRNFVVAEYQRGSLSVRESANILNLSYYDFLSMLGTYNISFINANKQELDDNYAKFQSFLNKHK